MPDSSTRHEGPTRTQLGVYALLWGGIVWLGALIALVILEFVYGPTS